MAGVVFDYLSISKLRLVAIRACRKPTFLSFAHYALAYLSVYHKIVKYIMTDAIFVAFLLGIIFGLVL